MGRKRSRTRQLVYFCIAQLIALSLSSCGLISRAPEHEEDQAQVAVGRGRLLSQQDFDGAAKENQRAITLARNRPPVDEALFQLGLISATVGNPKRDNRAAMGYFKRVIREYPQSLWVDQAKT